MKKSVKIVFVAIIGVALVGMFAISDMADARRGGSGGHRPSYHPGGGRGPSHIHQVTHHNRQHAGRSYRRGLVGIGGGDGWGVGEVSSSVVSDNCITCVKGPYGDYRCYNTCD